MVNNPYPYDKNGYCIYCRKEQSKPHDLTCSYQEAVKKAKSEA